MSALEALQEQEDQPAFRLVQAQSAFMSAPVGSRFAADLIATIAGATSHESRISS